MRSEGYSTWLVCVSVCAASRKNDWLYISTGIANRAASRIIGRVIIYLTLFLVTQMKGVFVIAIVCQITVSGKKYFYNNSLPRPFFARRQKT